MSIHIQLNVTMEVLRMGWLLPPDGVSAEVHSLHKLSWVRNLCTEPLYGISVRNVASLYEISVRNHAFSASLYELYM